jgi:hypothetical protein
MLKNSINLKSLSIFLLLTFLFFAISPDTFSKFTQGPEFKLQAQLKTDIK